MSGRGTLALCAFAATVTAAASLLPLVGSTGWMVQAVFLLAVQSGAGALALRVSPARPLIVAVQALVTLLLLTVVFARDQALLGVLPGPGAFGRFGELLTSGADDVGRYASPAPATGGIRLMVIGGVLLIGLAVDALAVVYRCAAPAGLPLLALHSVAAGLSGGASWIWFLLAACGYLVLLLAEGRERLSQWGRVLGGTPPGQRRTPGGRATGSSRAPAPVRTGRRIGVLALGVALVVPAALPSLDGGLLGGVGNGPGPGAGGRGGTIDAVNPLVALDGSLKQSENREVLRYRTTAPVTKDLYLRIVSLDEFNGAAWSSSQRKVEDVPERLPEPPGLSPAVGVTEVRTNLSAAGTYKQNWLPLPYPATTVGIEGNWRFEPEGRGLVGDRGQTTSGVQYSVSSLAVRPTQEQLAQAAPAPAALLREYTQVPEVLPDEVRQTARKVTMGAANDWERAVTLQDWFARKGGFVYDTKVASGTGAGAITRFLKQKEGFCVHFSFSMAAMARTLGIPARVAVGFTPGTPQSDGTISVGLRDAHAWPELYFEGVGWTRFEPTPSRGSVPDYARPQAPAGAPTSPAQPEATGSSAPLSARPTDRDACPEQERRLGECGAAAPHDIEPIQADGSTLSTVLTVSMSVAGAALVLLLPLLWRIRTRKRRLSTGVLSPAKAESDSGIGEERAAGTAVAGRTAVGDPGRTLAVWREVNDMAWDFGIPPDESQTPRRAAARIVRLGRLEDEPAAAVHRMARAVEQVLYAPAPRPSTGLAEDARQVRLGLRDAAGFWTRLRALLLPPSAVRVVWAVSERWTAFAERWSPRRPGPERWTARLRLPSRQRG